MLDKSYLASNSFYASLAHSQNLLQDYFNAMDEVFGKIAKLEPYDILGQLRVQYVIKASKD